VSGLKICLHAHAGKLDSHQDTSDPESGTQRCPCESRPRWSAFRLHVDITCLRPRLCASSDWNRRGHRWRLPIARRHPHDQSLATTFDRFARVRHALTGETESGSGAGIPRTPGHCSLVSPRLFDRRTIAVLRSGIQAMDSRHVKFRQQHPLPSQRAVTTTLLDQFRIVEESEPKKHAGA